MSTTNLLKIESLPTVKNCFMNNPVMSLVGLIVEIAVVHHILHFYPDILFEFKNIKGPEMVVFFTGKLEPWKTKLNKLLFYADFINHKQTDFSMSGVQYRAIPMGPVPNNFYSIFEYLANKNELNIYYTNFADGGTGEQFTPNPNSYTNSSVTSFLKILRPLNFSSSDN